MQVLDGKVLIFLSCLNGNNRLMSYINDKLRIDKFIEVKKLIDIYMAGNMEGALCRDHIEYICSSFNLLLSYEWIKKKKSLNIIIDKKKELKNGYIYGRPRKRKYIR